MIHPEEIPELFKRLQAFHEDRLDDLIVGNQMPFVLPIDAGGLLVVHVMPLDALSFGSFRARAIDLLENAPPLMPPISNCTQSHAAKPNFEGVLTCYMSGDKNSGYVQASRNGIMEGVAIEVAFRDNRNYLITHSCNLEIRIVETVLACSENLERVGFHPPFAIFTAILNAKDVVLDPPSMDMIFRSDPTPFERDRMSFTPAIAYKFLNDPEAWAQLLRPTFDQIANAGGFRASQNFARDGTWKLTAGGRVGAGR